ncbi:hypothetical protein CXT94_05925 [Akkermansia muciniphila]|nr:hypothetical protein CXT94_05925 [Akkermansia muciniphila]QAA63403.1 hypothetical protein C1O60_00915 [Akkermansia muciniphila]
MIFRKWLHDLFLPQVVPPSANGKGYPGGLKKQERLQPMHTDSGLLRRGGLHGHAWCYAAAFVAG